MSGEEDEGTDGESGEGGEEDGGGGHVFGLAYEGMWVGDGRRRRGVRGRC